MKKQNLIVAMVALLLINTFAFGSATVELNTGYNHPLFQRYNPVIGVSNTLDQYWMDITLYPTVTPAFVIEKHPVWAIALPDTNWINSRNTFNSLAGINPDNPGYKIFRKCFCLLPGYKDAKLGFQVRADDSVQVWLNTQTNQVLAPSWGNFNGTPLSASTVSGFRTGKNCLYVLVEDYWGGATGFDLLGSVTANGLLPMPAAGVGQSFEPCACRGQGPAVLDNGGAASTLRAEDPEKLVVSEIVKVAEARRAAKQMRIFQGKPTILEAAPGRTDPIKRPNN